MKETFADTFYFLAVLNPKDRAHARALAYTSSFNGEMVTTAWVLTELGDAMSDPASETIGLGRMVAQNGTERQLGCQSAR